MAEPIDQEIEAIKSVLSALSPLSEKARISVLDYVSKRLNLPTSTASPISSLPSPAEQLSKEDKPNGIHQKDVHISALKEHKSPRSANEMAALVAYYLGNVAPQDQRKSTINQSDIETYFKIAKFPLPKSVRMTLINAKISGYFDSVSDGEYKLNAVGYNLVEHNLPRSQKTGPGRSRKGGKRSKSSQRPTPSKVKRAKKSR
ncbi:MAG: hypothetical protein OXL95_04455 [Nitrospira sp.]|nr:hypothetical protein [Nitrospira sp.]